MIITEIHIDSFAGLRNRHVTLNSGINIISGKNESGKSSLCDFVRFILFGITDGEKEKSYVSLYTGKACGSMVIALSHEEISDDIALPEKIRIEREYIPGQTDSVKMTNAVSGAAIDSDRTSPGEYLFGFGAAVYDSTAYVSQLGGKAVNGQKLSEAMKNILYSADESVDAASALASLDDSAAVLCGAEGEIASLLTAREALRSKLDVLEKNAAECKKYESDLASYEKRIQDNALKLQAAEERVKCCETSLSLVGKNNRDDLREKHDQLIERKAQIRENASYEGFLPNDAYIERISFLRDSISEERNLLLRMNMTGTMQDSGDITPEKAALISDIESNGGFRDIEHRAEDSNTKKKAYLILAFILFAIFTVAVCVGLVLLRDGEKRGVIPILIGLTSLAATVITIISRRQAVAEYYDIMNLVGAYDLTDLYRIIDTYEREGGSRTGMYGGVGDDVVSAKVCTDRINEMETELTELLSYWNMESVENALECYSRFTARIGEIDYEIEQQNALIEESGSDACAERRERLYGILGETASSPDFPSDPAQVSAALDTARREYGFFRGAADALLEKKHEIELSLTECRARISPIAPVLERLSEVEAILERKTKQSEALSLAAEKLRDASDSLRNELAPALSAKVGNICREISDGRYHSAEIGPELTMKLSDNTAEADKPGMEYLSGGTRDMAYIALRLALVGQLCVRCVPTVIFDESFCHMDDERLRRTLSLLDRSTSGSGSQILIFSSQERESRISYDIGLHYTHTTL